MPRHPDTVLSAIKNAVDIVALVSDYQGPARRVGSRYKVLCPFHDDHNPSLELNPERQSFKCWSCGAGGDVFDFVKRRENVDFPEAMRMLADRAGIVLERQPAATGPASGPTKTDLLEVNAWAEGVFAAALVDSGEARSYVQGRGLSATSIERFHLGYAPETRGWLMGRARQDGYPLDVLESAGLLSRGEGDGPLRERFRGRLMFPIRDERGRVVGFGGRILPGVERAMAERGLHTAKYLNTPETTIFRKRTILYGADLAREAGRRAGWVAVVEGYTDVIAAHQVGLENVVGTLGTALGQDHVGGLKRLSDRVVLVFDGDEAGLSAADRSLELFLAAEVDLRVLTLPAGFDPCDFLLRRGAAEFGQMAERAPDPVSYLLERARARFDVDSPEGARRAAEWALEILSRVPPGHGFGIEVKTDKALDRLSFGFRISKEALLRTWHRLRRPGPGRGAAPTNTEAVPAAPIRTADLDPIDTELIRIVLNEPGAAAVLAPRLPVSSLRDDSLRMILQACYALSAEGRVPGYQALMSRLDDPQLRALATDLAGAVALRNPEPAPVPEDLRPAPWRDRLEQMLAVLDNRERRARLEELKRALDAPELRADPDAHRAIELEYRRLLTSGRSRRA